jgi:hypothetical protein
MPYAPSGSNKNRRKEGRKERKKELGPCILTFMLADAV